MDQRGACYSGMLRDRTAFNRVLLRPAVSFIRVSPIAAEAGFLCWRQNLGILRAVSDIRDEWRPIAGTNL